MPLLTGLIFLIVGCGQDIVSDADKEIPARPVRYLVLKAQAHTRSQTFSGTAAADREAVLSFKVAGTVKDIPVKVGDRVASGTLLARLDETDLQVDLESARSGLKTTQADAKSSQTSVYTSRSNYGRIQKLYENDNVSLSEFEQARGDYETALAQLQAAKSRITAETTKLRAAKNQLLYTRLSAPFDGIINSIAVEENEEISSGSAIATLSGLGKLEIKVDVSDLYIASIKAGQECRVTFPALDHTNFEGRVEEVPYAASDAPTYPVTVGILSRDSMPPYVVRVATIVSSFPGANPQRVELLVSKNIEEVVQEIPEVKTVISQSRTGLSVVTVTLKDEVKEEALQGIWDELRRKLENMGTLPEGVSPLLKDDNVGAVYGIILGLVSDEFSYEEMEDVAKRIRDDLITLPDSAKVVLGGVQEQQVVVEFDTARLSEYGLTVGKLQQIIKETNILDSGGEVNVGEKRLILEHTGNYDSLEALKKTIIPVGDQGEVVYLDAITQIQKTYKAPSTGLVRVNGKPAISLSISLKDEANIITLGKMVSDKIGEYNRRLPLGFDVIRLASLDALIMALGMMVDNGIVVSESFIVKMEEGKDRMAAAVETCQELMIPLLISTLTTSAAFLSFFLAESAMGDIMGPLFVVISFALVSSWIMSLTIIPLLAYYFVKVKKEGTAHKKSIFDLLNKTYISILNWVLKLKLVFVLLMFIVFFVSLKGFSLVPFIFFPDSDRNMITVDINLALGTKIENTLEIVQAIEDHIASNLKTGPNRPKGITDWSSYIGEGPESYDQGYSADEANSSYAHILVNTSNSEDNGPLIKNLDTFCFNRFPNADIKVSLLGQGGGSMWEPMAVSIMVGLLFGTTITLLFIPALYCILYKVKLK